VHSLAVRSAERHGLSGGGSRAALFEAAGPTVAAKLVEQHQQEVLEFVNAPAPPR